MIGLLLIMRRYREHCHQMAERPAPPTEGRFKLMTIGELMSMTEADRLEGVLRDPVRAALRAEAREIGWRAFAAGGTNKMHAVFEAMERAQNDTENHGAVLDHWWDGIGNRDEQWTA